MIPPALLLIDLQRAIDDPRWAAEGPRNNPEAEANVARLLAAWRARGWPLIHVRHDSVEPNSSYRPGQPGNAFKDEAMPLPGETIVAKRTNSAFIGTGLDDLLRGRGVTALVIAGVITNNSVEATARMAGNLGYATTVVSDATYTFAKRDLRGRVWSAEDVHALSLANMAGEYARVMTTEAVLNPAGTSPG
ncbi:cysteine hydrolase family protein [Nitrospirillum iridis]|uniref:Nicotinamidase-related amidase n=1 Tax=Nitrospirillum iridis TaxID=765888 RepID=A0A7X0EE69_9PROT|nr:cysteine hydrolase family protein [Nitrospirillum iridis]MBB6253572.1 nicotinamidase-related amidase [Nitrospirillum iridis]